MFIKFYKFLLNSLRVPNKGFSDLVGFIYLFSDMHPCMCICHAVIINNINKLVRNHDHDFSNYLNIMQH